MKNFAALIDHTLLKPNATREQFQTLCREAKEYQFATVCVNPSWISLCKELLQDSGVGICTVIGFPLGAVTTNTKAFETKDAISSGATEIDMVINVGQLIDGNDDYVYQDILAVVEAAGTTPVKVIIETTLLNDEQKVRACQLSMKAKAAFVKTSTGFAGGGATIEDVKLMKETVGDTCLVKASGGVRDPKAAADMVEAGASRLGTSSGVSIASGEEGKSSY